MTINVAINGYGRIGRNILRALYEAKKSYDIKIIAINDLGDIETNALLTRYDSTHGQFPGEISFDNNNLIVNGDAISFAAERDPKKLPWGELNIDVVYECTGIFADHASASGHIAAGAKKVLVSAPCKNAEKTIVYGVNHQEITSEDKIISNASCTTNCLAPLVFPLQKNLGIISGLMNTIHAFTKDQSLLDGDHADPRRARAATESIIPTKTGAAAAVGLVLPELQGKLDGFAMRVPTKNVSVVDLTFIARRETSVEEVNSILESAASAELKDILTICREPLVSIDFNHNPASSIVDIAQTKVIGNLVKVCAWYDNEWGFSNRMLDVTELMG